MIHTTKHTPGPWKAMPDRSRNMFAWSVEGAKGVVPTIARLSLIDACEEIEGNAHLIAAAPAMYEALKFLTSEIDLSKLNVRKDFSLMNAHAWAIKVILQAEGKLL